MNNFNEKLLNAKTKYACQVKNLWLISIIILEVVQKN